MADPAEVTNVVSSFEGLTSEANKKLCLHRIWDYMYSNYEESSLEVIAENIMIDVRSNPEKYNILFK